MTELGSGEHADAAGPADTAELIAQAWAQCYLDPERALALARAVISAGGPDVPIAWFHVALAHVRMGDLPPSVQALEQARRRLEALGDARGIALCDEVAAIQLRHAGDYAGCRQLHDQIDSRGDLGYTDADRFIARNSRAITCKLLGATDAALGHFYAALQAAQCSGLEGHRVTALVNLGAYHQALFNMDDSRQLTEQALAAATQAGSTLNMVVGAVNLVAIYHAMGLMAKAREMVSLLTERDPPLSATVLNRYAVTLALGHMAVGEYDDAQRLLDRGATAGVGDGDGMLFWTWLQARCLLARGQASEARRLVESTLEQRDSPHQRQLSTGPYEQMQVLAVAADACEALGDAAAALGFVRQSHAVYEEMVGRSARARYIALQARHELFETQRERDLARNSQREAEQARAMLLQLNEALQAQIDETALLHTKLQEQALRDPLTGLHNRRYLFEIAPGLLDLARRQKSNLVVVLLDLDHFKLLNDTYGHHAGDAVLQRFSALLTQMLRRSDVICRHGGEEFVAVMPDITPDGAQTMLTRLLQAYQSQPQEVGRRRLPSCSFSAGIAQFPAHGHTLEQLLSRADKALYTAKARGRARIETMPMTDFGTLA